MGVKEGTLSYNGTTYRLGTSEIADLLARGVIVRDPATANSYELAADHLIEEIGANVGVVAVQSGAQARHEGDDLVRQKMLAVRYMHRDGQGGAR